MQTAFTTSQGASRKVMRRRSPAMKMMFLSALSTLSVCSMLAATAAASRVTAIDDPSGFQAFLRRFEEGTGRFINGDATLWKQHVSQRDDATIMGGFGGYEKGREVGPRY